MALEGAILVDTGGVVAAGACVTRVDTMLAVRASEALVTLTCVRVDSVHACTTIQAGAGNINRISILAKNHIKLDFFFPNNSTKHIAILAYIFVKIIIYFCK